MQRYPPGSSLPPNLNTGPRARPGSPRSSSPSFSAAAPTSPRGRIGGSRQLSSGALHHSDSDEEDDRRRPQARKGALPLYSGTRAAGGSGRVLGSRLRGGRLRWVLLGVGVLALLLWKYSPVQDNQAASTATPAELEETVATTKERPIPRPAPPAPQQPKQPPLPPLKIANRPSPPPAPLKIVNVDVHPSSALASSPPPTRNERFLAYSPHSGYHNQRISLENALTFAFILGRTLLVPPVWVGHAIPYISFDKLGRRLEMASKTGLDRCKEFGEGGSKDPVPRECEGYWSWTQVGWEFLVDLREAEKLVPMRERWNQTEAWLEEELELRQGKGKAESPDIYRLKDDTMYQYRFYDSKDDNEPLAKFETRLDITELTQETEAYKLLHVGTLFGTSRLRVFEEANFDARSTFRRAMVFKNELLDEITETIRDRMGGAGRYYGLHLRVGDGIFQKEAKSNMATIWTSLCTNKMKLSEEVCDEMAQASEAKRDPRLRRRALDSPATPSSAIPSSTTPSTSSPFTTETLAHVKRANSRPQREGAYNHAPLPPLPTIKSRQDSPLASSLTCRRPLHTLPHLLPFNAPLFIATDSKLPNSDPNLSIFFDSFPCTFTLGDFASTSATNSEAVEGLTKLNGLRNKDDKVPLGQFLYPQLDAQIAAWGRGLLGTPQSTYSRFAVDVLHQVYHGWEIVERG
ncbi:hypothetical protein BCR35DRAFT_286797 [Leucosporidium creatinivorum]|uniref:GDP-fucose protein O-fucosyltransferase-domain-containing protein n=1 Tax=Leucosporidium creatinivorum TaxID=106004 RepID=A0A1Y2G146_9BASI|nr:hypothetical protein BCR35DRAFT_286797 [Leucosporidium creatinivorum]